MQPVHVVSLLRRKPGMTQEAFSAHWLVHPRNNGVTALSRLEYFGYSQNHPVVVDTTEQVQPTGSYDGWAEFFYADLDRWHEMRRSSRMKSSVHDEAHFLAAEPEYFVGRDEVVMDGPAFGPGYKILRLLRRRAGMRLGDFHQAWRQLYGPALLVELPGLVRYVQVPLVASAYLDAQPRWDAVEILWVRDIDESRKILAGRAHDFVDDVMQIVGRPVVPDYMTELLAASDPGRGSS